MVHFSVGYVPAATSRVATPGSGFSAHSLSSAHFGADDSGHPSICLRAVSDRVADVRIGSLIAMNVIFFVPSPSWRWSPLYHRITAAWRRHSWLTPACPVLLHRRLVFRDEYHRFYLISSFRSPGSSSGWNDLSGRFPDRPSLRIDTNSNDKSERLHIGLNQFRQRVFSPRRCVPDGRQQGLLL